MSFSISFIICSTFLSTSVGPRGRAGVTEYCRREGEAEDEEDRLETPETGKDLLLLDMMPEEPGYGGGALFVGVDLGILLLFIPLPVPGLTAPTVCLYD